MLPLAFIEHQMPGRLRLRVPSKRGDPAFFQAVAQSLSQYPCVEALTTDPRTGSIIVTHCEAAEAVFSAAAAEGRFRIGEKPPPAPRTVMARPTDAAILELAASGLAFLGLLQLRRGQALGPSTEQFWNAFGAQRILQSRTLARDFAILGLIQLLRLKITGAASSLLFNALVTHGLAQGERPRSRAASGLSVNLDPVAKKMRHAAAARHQSFTPQ